MIAMRPIVSRLGRLNASCRMERRRDARSSRSSGSRRGGASSGLGTRWTLDPPSAKLHPARALGSSACFGGGRDGLLERETSFVQRATEHHAADAAVHLAARAGELAHVLERADAA